LPLDPHEGGWAVITPGGVSAPPASGEWAGFALASGDRFVLLQAPIVSFLGLAPLLVLPVLVAHVRTRRRRARGLCVECGYDLRHSPLRCPECGTEMANAGEPAASPDASTGPA
jgi:hypothetical protein